MVELGPWASGTTNTATDAVAKQQDEMDVIIMDEANDDPGKRRGLGEIVIVSLKAADVDMIVSLIGKAVRERRVVQSGARKAS